MTTEPAPIVTFSFISTGKIVLFEPIKTLSLTVVFKKGPDFGRILFFKNLSLIKVTECPIKQLSPIFVFSQINV